MKYSYKHYIISFSTLEKTGRTEIGRQFSTFSLLPFLKTGITFAVLRFSGDCFFKRFLKNFEENDLYRIIDITTKTIVTNGLVSFERLECFFKLLKRTFFMFPRSIALRYIFTQIFRNYWNPARKCSTYTSEIFVKFFFGDSLLSFYSFRQRTGFFFCFPIISFITCHVRLVSYLYLFSKEPQQFSSDFHLSFSKIFLQLLYFFSDSTLLFFKNLIYSLCLVLEDFFSPFLNQGIFKFLNQCKIYVIYLARNIWECFVETVCTTLSGI